MPVEADGGLGSLTEQDRAATDAVLLHFAETAFLADPPARIGVAVSGGSDSMALLHLFHRAHPGRVWAVTVDHGLRAESAAEAAGVGAFCAKCGIPHATLRWQGPAPSGNLMDQARRARLALIAGWANANGISHVVLGHTANDQAESFLMNLARTSGLEGLSGMRPQWQQDGIHWLRPFLHIPRQDLRDYLCGQGVAWVDDPSNDNDRFTRVKARKVLAALAPLGIGAEEIAASVQHLADARQALNHAVCETAQALITVQAGALTLPWRSFWRLMPDMQRRLLIAVINWMSGADYPPRAAQLQHLEMALREGRDSNLGGLRFRRRGDDLLIQREARAVMPPVPFGGPWDHRWQVNGPALPGLEIGALGAEGLHLCPGWRDHGPRDALITTPALWQAGRLIAAPLAGNPGEYRAELVPGLNSFILSH